MTDDILLFWFGVAIFGSCLLFIFLKSCIDYFISMYEEFKEMEEIDELVGKD